MGSLEERLKDHWRRGYGVTGGEVKGSLEERLWSHCHVNMFPSLFRHR
jgi:hypothetical protein